MNRTGIPEADGKIRLFLKLTGKSVRLIHVALNPLAAAPGLALAQIYAEVAAAGESMSTGLVIAFLAVGPLIAIALLAGVWRRPAGGPDWSWSPIWC